MGIIPSAAACKSRAWAWCLSQPMRPFWVLHERPARGGGRRGAAASGRGRGAAPATHVGRWRFASAAELWGRRPRRYRSWGRGGRAGGSARNGPGGTSWAGAASGAANFFLFLSAPASINNERGRAHRAKKMANRGERPPLGAQSGRASPLRCATFPLGAPRRHNTYRCHACQPPPQRCATASGRNGAASGRTPLPGLRKNAC